MIEDSPEGFVQRWRRFAAEARSFAHTEGAPLLELDVGGVIVQALERTGPYLKRPGKGRFIVNPMVERLLPAAAGERSLEVAGLGRLRGQGEVLLVEEDLAVIDCGVPIVVALLDRSADVPAVGSFASFDALPPVHAFLVADTGPAAVRRQSDSTEDWM